MYFSYC